MLAEIAGAMYSLYSILLALVRRPSARSLVPRISVIGIPNRPAAIVLKNGSRLLPYIESLPGSAKSYNGLEKSSFIRLRSILLIGHSQTPPKIAESLTATALDSSVRGCTIVLTVFGGFKNNTE